MHTRVLVPFAQSSAATTVLAGMRDPAASARQSAGTGAHTPREAAHAPAGEKAT